MARVYETSVVLLLLTLLVLGIVWVASAIMDNNAASRESLYGESMTAPGHMCCWCATPPRSNVSNVLIFHLHAFLC